MTPTPFRINVPEATLSDLRERLRRTRFPDQAPGNPWAFGADLEVRCYDDASAGWARQGLVLDALGADFVGPRRAEDLSGQLAPLTEVAGWLGFLRWAERADPAGFDALCAE